jgi:hypothetical protein
VIVYFGQFFEKSSKYASRIFWPNFTRLSFANFAEKWFGRLIGRIFRKTHLVTLLGSDRTRVIGVDRCENYSPDTCPEIGFQKGSGVATTPGLPDSNQKSRFG